MSMMSNVDIHEAYYSEQIDISPFDPNNVQPSSYDVHLGDSILLPVVRSFEQAEYVDPLDRNDELFHQADLADRHGPRMYIEPGDRLLAHTKEVISLHDLGIAADITGISSIGRYWLFVHATAGFIDPGWMGQLTLELCNASPWSIRIWAGMRIAQIRFYRLLTPATMSYSSDKSHYFGSRGAVAGRYYDS